MGDKAKTLDADDNVVRLPLPSCGEFTPRERARLREMMEVLDKVTTACPIARRIAYPED